LSDERITQLRELPQSALASGDVLPIVDVSSSQTKKIKASSLLAGGINLIPSGTIDLSLLNQGSTTKLGASALASGAVTATKLAADSSVVVATLVPSGDNFEGRGYFNSSTGNLQIYDGATYQQVVMPSGGIGDGQITTAKLASGCVTTDRVSALGSAAFASGSVTTTVLADGAVTAVKIASGTITSGQIASGSISTNQLANGAVTYGKIQATASGNVVLGRISGSGTVEEIACTAAGRTIIGAADAAAQRTALGIGNIALGSGTWVDGSSVNGTCSGTNTGDQTITLTGDLAGTGTGSFAATITNSAVTTAKIADGAVTGAKLASGTIPPAAFDDNSAVVVAATVPIGNGAFIGQQWVNTNTGIEYTWTGSEWQRLAGLSTVAFSDSTPLSFSVAYPDAFSATITTTLDTQQAATFFAGPVSGTDTSPSFRALQASDLPIAASGSIGASKPGTGLLAAVDGTFDHSNSVTSGTFNGITFDNQGHITGAVVLASGDIPDLDASKIAGGEFGTVRFANASITGPKLANYSTAQIGETLPVADFTGQIFFNPLNKSFYLWDGNVWQPIGISIGGIVFAGTYNASGNTVSTVTPEGTAIGLVAGSGLVSAAAGNQNYYLVVASGGTGTAPAPTVALSPPDLILSNGSSWTEIDISSSYTSQTAANVSFTPAGTIGSTSVQAAVEEVNNECRNADNMASGTLAVARGGTGLSAYVKGDLVVGSGTTALAKLGVGTNGQFLKANSAAPYGVEWATVSGNVTQVSSTTTALTVTSGTTTPVLSIASASTSASGIVMLTNSISTTSSVLAATATAVKSAYDVAAGALQASGSTITGELRVGTTGSFVFEGSVDDGFETTLAVANPTIDRTITLPNETGTVITTGGSGVVTSTMIVDGTIVNADVNNSAAIAGSKITPDFTANVRIGQTDSDVPGADNSVYGASIRTSGNGYFSAQDAIAGLFNRSNTGALVSLRRAGTVVGSISVTASDTAFNTTSDYRLKENIAPISSALADIARLKPCSYNFVNAPNERRQGFIAHELQDVVPQAVTGAKDAMDGEGNPLYQGVDASKMVPLLTAAIQELMARVAALEHESS
jgi:hypothetical protein